MKKSYFTLPNIIDSLIVIWFLSFILAIATSSRNLLHSGIYILLTVGILCFIQALREYLLWRQKTQELNFPQKILDDLDLKDKSFPGNHNTED